VKLNLEEAANKNIGALLVLSFCALVLAKALLSLKFQSPWLLPDEVAYAKMAGDIFGLVHSELSWGYPFLLSIAYVFSEDMSVVYHLMLLINCFLSSLILFPSFFILNKYCPRGFSFAGAITIAALPSLTLYSFLITTENLFVPLFVFSIWFLLEAYETEKPFWIALAISSVLLLFFSRHTGIFMMAAMAGSQIYYLLSGMRSGDVRQIVLRKWIYIIFIVLFISLLALFGLALTGSDRISYFYWFYNRVNVDGQIFLNLFKDGNLMKEFLVLLRNEVGYLIIASYFIFSYIFIVFFSKLFFASFWQNISPHISTFFNSLGRRKGLALKTVAIYYLLASAILILTTTMAVYRFQQEIIGRYIDPIIPGLFLFGFVGLYHMHNASEKQDLRVVAILTIIFALIFFNSYPILTPNIVTIYYINFLKSLAPNWIIFPALAAGFFLLLHSNKNMGVSRSIFFAVLIIFSVCTSAYTYHADLVFHSKANYEQNQIGDYLSSHFTEDMLVIMDENDVQKDWYFESMTRFWLKSELMYRPITENLSDLKSDKEKIHLITSKVLPLEPLAASTRGYYLYYYNSKLLNNSTYGI
jgi:hypothetical protein